MFLGFLEVDICTYVHTHAQDIRIGGAQKWFPKDGHLAFPLGTWHGDACCAL